MREPTYPRWLSRGQRLFVATGDALTGSLAMRYRRGIAIGFSTLVHALLIVLLLWQPAPQVGQRAALLSLGGESANDAEINFTLIDLSPLKRPISTEAMHEKPVLAPVPSPPTDAPSLTTETAAQENNQQISNQTEPLPSAKAKSNNDDKTIAGAPGQSEANEAILKQIERCLPDEARPSLRTAKLYVLLDSEGNLLTRPSVVINLTNSDADQRMIADEIVQAVLQCEPYS